jgi:hypothetical protein
MKSLLNQEFLPERKIKLIMIKPTPVSGGGRIWALTPITIITTPINMSRTDNVCFKALLMLKTLCLKLLIFYPKKTKNIYSM